MKQAAKGARPAPIGIKFPDPCGALEVWGRLHGDVKVLEDQVKYAPDADMHGRLRVMLSTVERMRGNLRVLLGEAEG